MAQFGFENDIRNVLKLDMPLANAPVPRWQRKASSSSSSAMTTSSSAMSSCKTPGAVSPGNRSLSTSKTPSKTPGKRQPTPSKVGADRYIPTRNPKQMEVASFLLSKENNEPAEASNPQTEAQKAWSTTVHGFDIDQAKILHLSGKPLNAPEGYQNNLKVLYSQVTTPVSVKKSRYISTVPDRILDAPDVRNDFYLHLMDWGSRNLLAVALSNAVYVWDAATGAIVLLTQMEAEEYVSSVAWSRDGTFLAIGTSDCKVQMEAEEYVSSVAWSRDGTFLAIGTSDCKVQLWDVDSQKRLRSMASHTARVGTLSWNEHILSSGSRSGHIHHHDVRVAEHHVSTLSGHRQEVCGLRWSPDGRLLASGGNDNAVFVWPGLQQGGGAPLQTFREHQGAVKALAWCPWQSNVLASGGGTSDRHIRIWNVSSGTCLSALDTHSQISALVFAPNYKELVSSHGFAHDNIIIWKYPSLAKVAELEGHEGRVLNLALGPDGSTVASLAADETVRLWGSFQKDPVKKTAQAPTSIIHQSIR